MSAQGSREGRFGSFDPSMILTMLASDRSTVTPLSPPPHQVRTDAPVTIRLLIPTPAQRVSLI